MLELNADLFGAVWQKSRDCLLRIRLGEGRDQVTKCFDGVRSHGCSRIFVYNPKHQVKDLVGEVMRDYVHRRSDCLE